MAGRLGAGGTAGSLSLPACSAEACGTSDAVHAATHPPPRRLPWDSEGPFHLAVGCTANRGSRALPAGSHVSGQSRTRGRLTAGRPASWGPGPRAGALRGPRSASPVPSLGGQQTQPSTPGGTALSCPSQPGPSWGTPSRQAPGVLTEGSQVVNHSPAHPPPAGAPGTCPLPGGESRGPEWLASLLKGPQSVGGQQLMWAGWPLTSGHGA